MDTLIFKIPVTIPPMTNNRTIEEICKTAIQENDSAFEPLFERLIDRGDMRVTVVSGSLEVVSMDVDSTGGVADLTFLSDYYEGCKDKDSVDPEDASVDFEIIGGDMVFNIELPAPWKPM